PCPTARGAGPRDRPGGRVRRGQRDRQGPSAVPQRPVGAIDRIEGRSGGPGPGGDEPGGGVPVAPVSNNVFGQFSTVQPLTLPSPGQFLTEGPPALTSAQYAAEFNEVKALGAQSGSSRTDAQTLQAGFFTANPLFYMNAGLRDISRARGLSTAEQALLLTKTSMASADALIGCWYNKRVWHNW